MLHVRQSNVAGETHDIIFNVRILDELRTQLCPNEVLGTRDVTKVVRAFLCATEFVEHFLLNLHPKVVSAEVCPFVLERQVQEGSMRPTLLSCTIKCIVSE